MASKAESEDKGGLGRDSSATEAMLAAYNTHQLLAVTNNVKGAIAIDMLPLARIKRIMKQDSCDPHPRMISAEAIPLMAYAAQLFIGSITSLAWQLSTSTNKRNTLQGKDLRAVVHASSRFDFLVDILDMVESSPQMPHSDISMRGMAMSAPPRPVPPPRPPPVLQPVGDWIYNPPQMPPAATQSLPMQLKIPSFGASPLGYDGENSPDAHDSNYVHPYFTSSAPAIPSVRMQTKVIF